VGCAATRRRPAGGAKTLGQSCTRHSSSGAHATLHSTVHAAFHIPNAHPDDGLHAVHKAPAAAPLGTLIGDGSSGLLAFLRLQHAAGAAQQQRPRRGAAPRAQQQQRLPAAIAASSGSGAVKAGSTKKKARNHIEGGKVLFPGVVRRKFLAR
jgi:hypothetical protein